jgi:hypothetical protein
MPTLTIVVTEAQAARIADAFGKRRASVHDGSYLPATMAEVRAAVIAFITGVVRDQERLDAAHTAQNSVVDIDVP